MNPSITVLSVLRGVFMINIWTRKYYNLHCDEPLIPAEVHFSNLLLFISNLLTNPKNSKYRSDIVDIVRKIENVNIVGEQFKSGFYPGISLNIDKLSTGCKTALVIYCYGLLHKHRYISLVETGPTALYTCLELLNNKTDLVGVILFPMYFDGDYGKLQFMLNDSIECKWITVAAQCEREG